MRFLDNLWIACGKFGTGGYGVQIKARGEGAENFFNHMSNANDEVYFSVTDKNALLLAEALEIAARQIRDSYNKNWMIDYLKKHGDILVDYARRKG